MSKRALYSKLLNSPQWKKKRAIILKRDKYRCTVCDSNENLRVHHTYYYQNITKPWQYPDKSLLTLCEDCHIKYHMTCEVEIRIKKSKSKKIKPERKLSLVEIQEQRGLRIKKRVA